MAEASGSSEDATVTFHVKSSGGQKYTFTLPLSTTTLDLKNKLATPEYANVPASAQRLIYSGKVLKDNDTLASHHVKEGNTMHLVKSAASNQRQNPANQQSSTAGATSGSTPQVTGVPQNLASGTGNDPLAGLTGARFAGFAQLPDARTFQNVQTPEDILRQLEDPNFQQMMREAMGNPQVIDMMINQHPQLRAMGPQARQILQSDYFRRVMTDPQALRSMLQMQQAMGMAPFGGGGGQEAFPAPGVTNTTDQPAVNHTANNATNQQQQPPPNPFATFGGGMGANPFASLFGPPSYVPPQNPSTTPQNAPRSSSDTAAASPESQQQQPQQPPPLRQNPFAALFNPALFGQPPPGSNDGSAPPPPNPFLPQTNPFYQNPEAVANLLQTMGGGTGNDAHNYGNIFDLLGEAPSAPQDDRPPEERYESQLRQLNDMGFYDFDRNVQALRRAGGSVQGAIEWLLNN